MEKAKMSVLRLAMTLAALALGIALPGGARAAIVDDLVVYLPYDGDLNDASGRGNHAAVGGGAPTVTGAGKFGNALTLRGNDGNNDHVTLGSPADLNFGATTDFTINTWIRMPEDQSQNNDGVSYVDAPTISNKDWSPGSNTGYIFSWKGGTGDDWFVNQVGAGSARVDTAWRDVQFNSWYMITGTFDRDGNITLYQNGSQWTSAAISPGSVDTGLATNIGQDGTGSYGYSYWGGIDDTAIWRRALSPAEVKRIYGGGAYGRSLGDLQVFDYTSGSGGDPTNWHDGANWSTGYHPHDPASPYPGETVYYGSEINIGPGHTAVQSSGSLGIDNAAMTVQGSYTLNANVWIADSAGTTGTLTVDGGTFNCNTFKSGDNGVGYVDIVNGGTMNCSTFILGNYSNGDGFGTLDGTLNVGGNLIVAAAAGATGSLYIAPGSVLNIGNKLYMNDAGGGGSVSSIVMDGGTLTTGGNCYFNDDSAGTATVTMNDGLWNSGGVIDVSWNLDGTSHLHVNGGEMYAGSAIRLGVGGGGNTGQSRIFMSGGLLQGENLKFTMNDSLIVFNAGEFRINNASLTEAGMQNLITTGKINPTGPYAVGTDGSYTTLTQRLATYEFTGGGDGTNWNQAANWTVTGSPYTWPNEQFGNEYTNEDIGTIYIGPAHTVNRGGWLSIDGARNGFSTATLTIDGGTLNVNTSTWIADWGGTKGAVEVINGGTFDVNGTLKVGDDNGSVGHLTVTDARLDVSGHLVVANRNGSTGLFTMNGAADVDVGGTLYIADAGGASHVGTVVMNGGTLDTGRILVGDDGGTGFMTVNDGTVHNAGALVVAWVNGVDGTYTQHDGTVINDGWIYAGLQNGAKGMIDLFGGKLQGEHLLFNDIGLLNFYGGELWIGNANVSEAAMQSFIDIGDIDVSGAPGYAITTIGDYTVLFTPEPATLALLAIGGALIARRRRRHR